MKDKSRTGFQLSGACAWLALQMGLRLQQVGMGGVRRGSGMVPHFPGDISGRWGDAELELHPGHL